MESIFKKLEQKKNYYLNNKHSISSEDLKELKKNIYNNYFLLVNKTLESFKCAIIVLVNSAHKEQDVIDEFNGKISDLRDDARKLCFYYEDYKLILGNDKELEYKYNELYRKFIIFNSGESNDQLHFLHMVKNCCSRFLI